MVCAPEEMGVGGRGSDFFSTAACGPVSTAATRRRSFPAMFDFLSSAATWRRPGRGFVIFLGGVFAFDFVDGLLTAFTGFEGFLGVDLGFAFEAFLGTGIG